MLSIAEFAHQRDPEAIAATIRQELQPLGIDGLVVEVIIVDSSLDLQIRTNAAVDKEKLLTLLHSELQNLRIESVAKFRVHCWRNDEEIHEQHLLWTEQFMIDSPSSLTKLPQSQFELDELDQEIASTARLPEPQLSKNSVLQEAISKIVPAYPKAKQHLVAIEKPETEIKAFENSSSSLTTQHSSSASVLTTSSNSYWQLLLVAASIILLGLGIGASVRALTVKASIDTTETQPVASPSQPAVQILATPKTPEVEKQAEAKVEIPSNTVQASPSAKSEALIDIPNTLKANQGEDAGKITLDKFNVVQKGMTVEEVEKIFGIAGKVIAENNDGKTIGMVYSWKNPEGSNAIIEFKDGQVVAKAQAGL